MRRTQWLGFQALASFARAGLACVVAGLVGCSLVPQDGGDLRIAEVQRALLPMASVALDTGQVETAKRLYQRLLDVDPDSFDARMGLGNVAFKDRRSASAARWYLAALAHASAASQRHDALLWHGRAALDGGKIEAARRSFRQLAEQGEQAPSLHVAWALNGIGLTLLLEGDILGAIDAMEQAVRLAGDQQMFADNLERALKMLADLRATAPPEPALPAVAARQDRLAANAIADAKPVAGGEPVARSESTAGVTDTASRTTESIGPTSRGAESAARTRERPAGRFSRQTTGTASAQRENAPRVADSRTAPPPDPVPVPPERPPIEGRTVASAASSAPSPAAQEPMVGRNAGIERQTASASDQSTTVARTPAPAQTAPMAPTGAATAAAQTASMARTESAGQVVQAPAAAQGDAARAARKDATRRDAERRDAPRKETPRRDAAPTQRKPSKPQQPVPTRLPQEPQEPATVATAAETRSKQPLVSAPSRRDRDIAETFALSEQPPSPPPPLPQRLRRPPPTAESGYVLRENDGSLVQMGAFAVRSTAETLATALENATDENVAVMRSGDFFRVVIGPVASQAALDTLVTDLRAHGHGAGSILPAAEQAVRAMAAAEEPENPRGFVIVEDQQRFLQLGAFEVRASADRLSAKLRDVTGEDVTVAESQRDDAVVFRVRVGPVESEESLADLVAVLSSAGYQID